MRGGIVKHSGCNPNPMRFFTAPGNAPTQKYIDYLTHLEIACDHA
jgi:hypothetical protein